MNNWLHTRMNKRFPVTRNASVLGKATGVSVGIAPISPELPDTEPVSQEPNHGSNA
jgi:hypothetical protein